MDDYIKELILHNRLLLTLGAMMLAPVGLQAERRWSPPLSPSSHLPVLRSTPPA